MALFCHPIQHTPDTKHIAVNCRYRSGDNHKVQNTGSNSDPHMLEGQNERTTVRAHLIPWVNGHNHKQGPDVKTKIRHGTELIAFGIDFSDPRLHRQ